MALTLTSSTLDQAQSLRTQQTAQPYDIAFGDEYSLVLAYTYDDGCTNARIVFNAGLFVEQDFGVEPDNAGFSYGTGATLPVGWVNMNRFNLDESEVNYSAQIRFTGALTFEIRLVFFATFDCNAWLGSGGFDNFLRLLAASDDDTNVLENSDDTVWRASYTGKFIGAFVSAYRTVGTNDITTSLEFLQVGQRPFLNAGLMTNPIFELSISSGLITDLAGYENTLVKAKINYGIAVIRARAWVVRSYPHDDSLGNFIDCYKYIPAWFSVPNPTLVSGTTYETNFSVDYTKLSAGERYYIIVVYYASNGYTAAYLSPEYTVAGDREILPIISGSFHNYAGQILSDYVEFSPLQRIIAEISIDKINYAALGGNFTATFTGARLNVNGSEIVFNTADLTIIDSVATFVIRAEVRVKDSWENSDINFIWRVFQSLEPTEIIYPQKIKVSQYEQNKVTPDLISTEFLDIATSAVVLSNCAGEDLFVETVKDAGADNYMQAAIWLDNFNNIREHDGFPAVGILPQLTNADQYDVDADFGVDDYAYHKIEPTINNGFVGMIGFLPIPAPPVHKEYLFFHFRNNMSTALVQLTEPIIYVGKLNFNAFAGIPPANVVRYSINATTYLTFAAWTAALPTAVAFDVIGIEVNINAMPQNTDWCLSLEVSVASAPPAGWQSWTIPFSGAKQGCDAMIVLDKHVEFDGLISTSGVYVEIGQDAPPTRDYTTYTYFLRTDFVAVNALIASLSGVYWIRFWYGHKGTAKFPNAGWSPLIAGNENATLAYRFLPPNDVIYTLGAFGGENNLPNYVFNGELSRFYDGATTYQRLNSMPNDIIAWGKKFVWHCSIYVTLAAGDRLINDYGVFIGGNYIGFQIRNGFEFVVHISQTSANARLFRAPLKVNNYNTITVVYNGGDMNNISSYQIVMNGLNINLAFSNTIGTLTNTWSVLGGNNRCAIGATVASFMNRLASGSKMKELTAYFNPNALPTTAELKTMHNSHEAGVGASGFIYNPATVDFKMDIDFSTNPLGVTSTTPITVLEQGTFFAPVLYL